MNHSLELATAGANNATNGNNRKQIIGLSSYPICRMGLFYFTGQGRRFYANIYRRVCGKKGTSHFLTRYNFIIIDSSTLSCSLNNTMLLSFDGATGRIKSTIVPLKSPNERNNEFRRLSLTLLASHQTPRYAHGNIVPVPRRKISISTSLLRPSGWEAAIRQFDNGRPVERVQRKLASSLAERRTNNADNQPRRRTSTGEIK